MKNILILCTALIMLCTMQAKAETERAQEKKQNHPYLIFTTEVENNVREAIKQNATWKSHHDAIIAEAGKIIDEPLLVRKVTGRRLLSVSRECLRRVTFLAYAYRMTGEKRFAQRAEKEMLNVSGFFNWNSSHFLDVGEMTLALAFGYDWLYDQLPVESRNTIANAMVNLGILQSFFVKNSSWLHNENNWNQVCNAGMTLGAMALYDTMPKDAELLIKRAVESVKLPMEAYAPDGAYPEGYTYWGYGTTFNVFLLDALRTFKGNMYDLEKIPGFLQTCDFVQNMIMSDGLCMNYGDCGLVGRFEPAMAWLAVRNNDPTKLYTQKYFLEKTPAEKLVRDRTMVFGLLWGTALNLDNVTAPAAKVWASPKAKNPVAVMRSTWTIGKGISAAIKGGTPSGPHAHMDAGTFVFSEGNTRWAIDLGPEDYNSIEQQGIDLWGRKQHAARWQLLRYGNKSHNTLRFDDSEQLVNGFATMVTAGEKPKFSYAVLDMSSLYADKVASVKRGFALVNDSYLLVRDEIRAGQKATNLTWNLTTKAQARVVNDKVVLLKQDGKTLRIELETKAKAKAKVTPAQTNSTYERSNEGVSFITFDLSLEANKDYTVQVKLLPQGSYKRNQKIDSVDNW